MIAMTVAQVAQALGGRLSGVADHAAAAVITGPVEFDSRRIRPGGLFVAFPGERVDGHDYAAAALAAGAVAVLATRPVAGPAIIVDDATEALARLAGALLARLPAVTTIGITGSSGKTSTKDLLAQLLERLGPTVAPVGSYNNELGLPHTVLRCDERTRFLVLEMGSRGPGHLTWLCQIAPPRIGVVINVGVAHIGEFGSVEAIAAAKGELIQALPDDGVAVLNADDHRVAAMAALTAGGVVTVGTSAEASVRAAGVRLDERGRASFTLVTPVGSAPVRLALSGLHQVGNCLLAGAVALDQGMALAELATALGDLQLVSGRRMDVFDTTEGVTVIDDSYNANPASTEVALRALAAIGRGRRRIAVLGYLAELGEHERAGHEQVGRVAAQLGIDRVVVVGTQASGIGDGAASVREWKGESVQVTDQDEAVRLLRRQLHAGDVVLVKGSRYRTWAIADALRGGRSREMVAP